MVTLDCLEMSETADRQPLFVARSPINHAVDMPGQYPSRLQQDGMISRL
jgi:hypothetical protein